MQLPINQIICGDNVQVLAGFPDNSIDLTVTSPPYDSLRLYHGYSWDFQALAPQLYRVTKPGGAVVWVVADATVDGSETGTSFRQALGFMGVGFKLHDTMIYRIAGTGAKGSNYAYWQEFEYMFVFSKGRPTTVNRLKDRVNATVGMKTWKSDKLEAQSTGRQHRGEVRELYGIRGNVWEYLVGWFGGDDTTEHSAPFPEKLAEDHILSWSNPGDVILDPFVGSGTTPKMAIKHGRRFIGVDISQEYCDLSRRRIGAVDVDMFAAVGVAV